MALETATYISDLVSTNPAGTDQVAQGDDHLRLLKSTIKATFPNITGVVTATQADINQLTGVTVVTLAGVQTLTSKTLTSPVLNTPTINGSGGALTLPAGPDTLVGRATTDTLTNKTLAGATIDSSAIGQTTPALLKGTTVTATVGFVGPGSGITSINGGNITAGTVGIAALSATGTRDTTTFLRGDGTFAVPPAGGGGGGTITGVTAGTGLTGGGTSGAVTLSLNTTAGGVGSLALCRTATFVSTGATVAGTSLTLFNWTTGGAFQQAPSNTLTGTWQNLGNTCQINEYSLFQRVS